MKEELISTAVFAGSPARTFEYRTTGVATTPHLRWSFSLKDGTQIACPVLASHNQVYVAGSAGRLFALDASSGDVLWSFPTQRDEDDEGEKMIRFCLDGTRAYVSLIHLLDGRLAYVSSTDHPLVELDLSTGQILRTWQQLVAAEEESFFLDTIGGISDLFVYNDRLFLVGGHETYWLDRVSGHFSSPIGIGGREPEDAWKPALCHDPASESDIIVGSYMVNNSGGKQKSRQKEISDGKPGVNMITTWRQNLMIIWCNTSVAFSFLRQCKELCRLV